MTNMSLATRCPHCKTVFLVREEQLRLRSGTVRCGVCSQTFDGTAGLIGRITHKPSLNLPTSNLQEHVAGSDATTIMSENMLVPASDHHEQPPVETAISGNAPIHSDEALKASFDKQLKQIRLDLDGFSTDIQSGDNPSNEADTTPSSAKSSEIRMISESSAIIHADQDSTNEENTSDTSGTPSAPLTDNITHQQRKSRIFSVFWSIGVIFLLLVLCGQLLYKYSERIVSWWPQAENMVGTTCKLLGCAVSRIPESPSLQVEYGELIAVENSNHQFSQQIVIVNNNISPQPWPSLVMEISDAISGNVLSRRIFEPQEYLPDDPNINKEWLPSGKTVLHINIEYQHDSAINSRIILINH